jgi:hypothetical protein
MASYKLANEWWKRKLAELTKPSPEVELLNRYKVQDLKEAIEKGQAARRILEALPIGNTVADEQVEVALGFPVEDNSRRLDLLAQVVRKVGGEHVQTDKTLEFQAERFLATERARGKVPGTYGDLAYYVKKLQTDCPILPKTLDVTTIDEATVTDFYAWLRGTAQVPIVQRKLWSYFRRLVRFFAGQRLCPVPFNLDDKIFSFDVTAKKIKTYTIEKVRFMLAGLPDRLKT